MRANSASYDEETLSIDKTFISLKPSGREIFAMMLAGIAMRIVVVLISFRAFDLCHKDCPLFGQGKSFLHSAFHYALRADGKSYMAYARALAGDSIVTTPEMVGKVTTSDVIEPAYVRDPSHFTYYDQRVFPGFPMLLAVAYKLGIPLQIAALAIPWLCAGVAAAIAGMLFADRRVGWAMVFIIPHYLLYSSMAMTEPILLAFILAGLLLILRGGHPLLGGALLGFAGLVRPNACFAVAGVLTLEIWRRDWRSFIRVGIGTAVIFAMGLLAIRWRLVDPFRGVAIYHGHAYANELFTWPFKSLVTTTVKSPRPPLWKITYIWLHVALAFSACLLAFRGARHQRNAARNRAMDILSLPWVAGNTVFVLCVGNVWGFHAFHRFSAWALPAIFWPLRGLLPRRWWMWIPIGVLSLGIAIGSVMKN